MSSPWQTPVPGPPQYYDLTSTVPVFKPIAEGTLSRDNDSAQTPPWADMNPYPFNELKQDTQPVELESSSQEIYNRPVPLPVRSAKQTSRSSSRTSTDSIPKAGGHSVSSDTHEEYTHKAQEGSRNPRLQKYRRIQKSRQNSSHPRARPESVYHSVNLAKAGEAERLVGAFWEAYLPNGQPFPQQDVFQVILGDNIVRDLSRGGTALYNSLLALGLSTMGKRKNDRMLLEAGGRMYTEAIHQLAQSFRSKSQWVEEQLPVPRLLGMWEVSPYHTLCTGSLSLLR